MHHRRCGVGTTARWGALALVLAVVVVGCGGQSEVTRGDYTIFVHGRSLPGGAGMTALIEGVLVARDGCVLIEQQEVDVAYPAVWPAGTSIVDDDPLTLELPSGESLGEGEAVRGGGGYVQAHSLAEVEIPDECVPDTGEVALFNPDDDPSVLDP